MKKININNFDECLYYEQLKNKLDVYLFPMENKKNFFALFGTKYGGENITFKVDGKEKKVPSGIAHFLEHKMFDIQNPNPFEFYAKTGTDVNAYTTNDYTAFHFFGNNDFYNDLEYLLKWITTFKTTKEKITKEQGIILEESRMYKDNPERMLYEKLKQNTLVNHPLRLKTIGTDEDITSIDEESLNLCYKSFYRPDNMFLIVVGSFDCDKTMELIEKTLKDFKCPKEKIEKIKIEEPKKVNKNYEEIKMNVKVPKVGYSIKISKDCFKSLNLSKYYLDYYLYMILNIGFGISSDFRDELLKKELFVGVSYQITDIDDYYLIDFYATSEKPKELIEELDKYLNKIVIKKDDFERIKKTWIASEVRMIDNINITANNIIDDILDYGEYKNEKIKDIRNLSYDTLLKVLKNCDMSNTSKIIIKQD